MIKSIFKKIRNIIFAIFLFVLLVFVWLKIPINSKSIYKCVDKKAFVIVYGELKPGQGILNQKMLNVIFSESKLKNKQFLFKTAINFIGPIKLLFYKTENYSGEVVLMKNSSLSKIIKILSYFDALEIDSKYDISNYGDIVIVRSQKDRKNNVSIVKEAKDMSGFEKIANNNQFAWFVDNRNGRVSELMENLESKAKYDIIPSIHVIPYLWGSLNIFNNNKSLALSVFLRYSDNQEQREIIDTDIFFVNQLIIRFLRANDIDFVNNEDKQKKFLRLYWEFSDFEPFLRKMVSKK